MRKNIRLIVLLIFLSSILITYKYGRLLWVPIYIKISGKQTVDDVILKVGVFAEARIKPYFDKAGLSYPSSRIALLSFKEEKILELWAEKDNKWAYIKTYPILGASGKLGPKLQEGDEQVPEGIYQVIALNPNSSYHLSIKINYPNKYDQEKGMTDGRIKLGGDIFIHGYNNSIGCIAIGNEAIEELFVLVAKMNCSNANVIIAPNDFRQKPHIMTNSGDVKWLAELYNMIQAELQRYVK
ncbi:MAG TPA: L,D-transpeptidase family protein [Planctomycetota bacterium]|nr:L,D-transpeptidase family protein [Planctomycetota bacterium]